MIEEILFQSIGRKNCRKEPGEPDNGSSGPGAVLKNRNYPAQQDRRATFFVKDWAASLRPSAIVR